MPTSLRFISLVTSCILQSISRRRLSPTLHACMYSHVLACPLRMPRVWVCQVPHLPIREPPLNVRVVSMTDSRQPLNIASSIYRHFHVIRLASVISHQQRHSCTLPLVSCLATSRRSVEIHNLVSTIETLASSTQLPPNRPIHTPSLGIPSTYLSFHPGSHSSFAHHHTAIALDRLNPDRLIPIASSHPTNTHT